MLFGVLCHTLNAAEDTHTHTHTHTPSSFTMMSLFQFVQFITFLSTYYTISLCSPNPMTFGGFLILWFVHVILIVISPTGSLCTWRPPPPPPSLHLPPRLAYSWNQTPEITTAFIPCCKPLQTLSENQLSSGTRVPTPSFKTPAGASHSDSNLQGIYV